MSNNIEHRAFFNSAEVNATLKRLQGPHQLVIEGTAFSKNTENVPRPIIKVPGRALIIDSEGKTWSFTTVFTIKGWKQHYIPCKITEPTEEFRKILHQSKRKHKGKPRHGKSNFK